MCGETGRNPFVCLAIVHYAPQCVCVCVCLGLRLCVLVGGLALNTLTHTKVARMTHGDLYVRMPSCSSARPLLNKKKKEKKKQQLGSQCGSVHADISDRKLEQGDREKNIGIHNGWKGKGVCLGWHKIRKENDRRGGVQRERRIVR